MNRFSKCLGFQFKSMIKTTAWFLGIYFSIYILLFLSVTHNVISGFYLSAAIFSFVYVIANYKTSYNYLLIFGNTRRNIFLSTSTANIILSVLLSFVAVFVLEADNIIIKVFSKVKSGTIVNYDVLNAIYGGNTNRFSELLWIFMFISMICTFSMLYGALAYKLGKIFVTVFWICFGLSWVGLPTFAGTAVQDMFIKAIKAFFCIGGTNGILLAPINFFISAVIICAFAYLLSAKQPQVA